MDLIVMLMVVGASVYASYKMAIEKAQNKIVWPVAAALFGPVPVVLQYIVADITQEKRKKLISN